SRRRHTRLQGDWSSDVCSSDLLSDELLSLRPEERRAIFEDAAGIRPFYTQRDDALRRLVRTEENMLRLGDLAAELEPQLKNLERSEERRVGKEGRSRWGRYDEK